MPTVTAREESTSIIHGFDYTDQALKNVATIRDNIVAAWDHNENNESEGLSLKQQEEINDILTSSTGSSDKYIDFSQEQKRYFEVYKNDKFLNKRFIAHLFGDSFIQDTIYEGWFITDALLHIITILKENEISPEVSKVLETLKKCLSWEERIIAFAIANEFSDIDDEVEEIEDSSIVESEEVVEVEPETVSLEETQEIVEADLEKEMSAHMQKIVAEIIEAIENLEIGQNILMHGGCQGHSALYEYKRTDEDFYSFSVYNTGTGVEKHNIIFEDENSDKVYGVYTLNQINLENIASTPFIRELLELKSISPDEFGEKLYDELLSKLEGVKEEVSSNACDYMLMQRSGTCSWKVFSAYLRYNLPLIQRKYIKLKSRLDVFQKWYDLGYPLDCVQISQDLLSRLIINHQFERFQNGAAPINLSREELLTMGIYKVKKTFNKYKFLLSENDIAKAENWHVAFTGQSIHAT